MTSYLGQAIMSYMLIVKPEGKWRQKSDLERGVGSHNEHNSDGRPGHGIATLSRCT